MPYVAIKCREGASSEGVNAKICKVGKKRPRKARVEATH